MFFAAALDLCEERTFPVSWEIITHGADSPFEFLCPGICLTNSNKISFFILYL